ncbi:MAG TPA: hypothetical protein PLU53_13600, partial [Bacteroidia bacterium]|nr:hypothetical protein [Bacteroidia bacterium]
LRKPYVAPELPKAKGPGRPKKKHGPGRPPKKRGPGRPPKAESIRQSKVSPNDLGKFIDLQSKILDVQRDVFKRTGKFDTGMHKQFSHNFTSIDKLIANVAKLFES